MKFFKRSQPDSGAPPQPEPVPPQPAANEDPGPATPVTPARPGWFARLRAGGLSAADAGERVGLDEATARSWEMARRSAARRVEAGPVTVEMPGGNVREIRA